MPDRDHISVFQRSYAPGLAAVFLLGAFLAVCLLLLPPRFFYQQGVRQFRMENHSRAVAFFERACATIPGFLSRTLLTASDRFRLYAHHGRALYQVAQEKWRAEGPTAETYGFFLRSKETLQQAAAIENTDYLTSYWQARTEHALERIHSWLYPDTPNPYDADALYRYAASLRPAGFTVRQFHARYVYETRRFGRIPILAMTLLEIYPPFYKEIKQEPYYTPALLPYMQQGLENAVKKGIRPREALNLLALLHQEQGNQQAAIETFKQYLAFDPASNTHIDFFFLATLYLQDGGYEKSTEAFVRSIDEADDREVALRRIYDHFRSRDQLIRFLAFTKHLEDTGMAVPGLDMIKVQTYLSLDQAFLARELLDRILTYNPSAYAFYLRANIAANERDWDAMEVFSQQATRLDSKNPWYHFLLARALSNQKKYASAEEAMTRAIRQAPEENAGYYHYRAEIRWHQKKYTDAARDWEKAVALTPENQNYKRRAAQAREKAGLGPVSGN